MAKPDKYPEWAREDEVDPVSTQPNVAEPPEEKKDSGWEREDLPPRQWLNWLQRLAGQWIKWLDEQVTDLLENAAFVDEQNTFVGGQTVAGQLATQSLLVNGNAISGGTGTFLVDLQGFVGGNIQTTVRYVVAHGMVTLTFPSEIQGTAGGSNALSSGWAAQGSPPRGIPVGLRPQSNRNIIGLCLNGSIRPRLANFVIGSGGTGSIYPMRVNTSPGDANGPATNLTGFIDGAVKGIPAGTTLTYLIND